MNRTRILDIQTLKAKYLDAKKVERPSSYLICGRAFFEQVYILPQTGHKKFTALKSDDSCQSRNIHTSLLRDFPIM